MRWLIILFIGLFALPANAGQTCGLEAPCEIEGGEYFYSPPEGADATKPLPVIIFYHGFRGSGRGVVRGTVKRIFGDAGYIVVAPNGAQRGEGGPRAWPARPALDGWRDDVAFTFDVLDDLEKRMPIDRDRIVISGFSAGGSMAWMVGCYEGDRISAVISIAGALRRPIPDGQCPGGPFRLLQIHGFTDKQVPLEGRGIRDWHQGDVFEALSLLRNTNQCRSQPSTMVIDEGLRCRMWTGCETDADIRLCLHDGGHGLPKGWAAYALNWLEKKDAVGQ